MGDVPDHLSSESAIDEADFLLEDFSTSDVGEVHGTLTEVLNDVADSNERYIVLGNYDEPQKKRLKQTIELLEYFNPDCSAFLLSDLEIDDDLWQNFYIKFKFALSFVDYPVLVAEDNDGGHELEMGEVPLEDTYVVKRTYRSISIDHDLEHCQYDAMIGKLFQVYDNNDQLFEWNDYHSFVTAVEKVGDVTSSDSSRSITSEDVERNNNDPTNDISDRVPQIWEISEETPESTVERFGDIMENIPETDNGSDRPTLQPDYKEYGEKLEEYFEEKIEKSSDPITGVLEDIIEQNPDSDPISSKRQKWVQYERETSKALLKIKIEQKFNIFSASESSRGPLDFDVNCDIKLIDAGVHKSAKLASAKQYADGLAFARRFTHVYEDEYDQTESPMEAFKRARNKTKL